MAHLSSCRVGGRGEGWSPEALGMSWHSRVPPGNTWESRWISLFGFNIWTSISIEMSRMKPSRETLDANVEPPAINASVLDCLKVLDFYPFVLVPHLLLGISQMLSSVEISWFRHRDLWKLKIVLQPSGEMCSFVCVTASLVNTWSGSFVNKIHYLMISLLFHALEPCTDST